MHIRCLSPGKRVVTGDVGRKLGPKSRRQKSKTVSGREKPEDQP